MFTLIKSNGKRHRNYEKIMCLLMVDSVIFMGSKRNWEREHIRHATRKEHVHVRLFLQQRGRGLSS